MEQTNLVSTNPWAETFAETPRSKGNTHACRTSWRGLQQAHDQLRWANRDLAETAAFVAASLTTVTAVEAVITLAIEKIELSKGILQVAFDTYIVILASIILWGVIRAQQAMRRRARAEREIEQAKKGIFEFCPQDQWPKLEE